VAPTFRIVLKLKCNMELARQEFKLKQPPNYGEKLYVSLEKRKNDPPQERPPKPRVLDHMQLQPTVTGPLDASRAVLELSQEEQCEFFSHYARVKKLIIRKWETMSDNVIRCISFVMGESLEELDLSYSAIAAAQLEVLVSRTTRMRVVTFTGCPNVGGQCMNVLARMCPNITELYVNKCRQFAIEPLTWLAGNAGFQSPCLRHIQALDLSDNPLEPEGLLQVASCCKKLTFLNLQNCSLLGDKCFISAMRSFPEMRLLNLSGVSKLSSKGLGGVSDNCPELMSLNISRCELVTNKGIAKLAEKCRKLQALNLAGLNKLDESPLCALTNNCKNLIMLNLTGITDVTVAGLDALIQGVSMVERAYSFVGFRPVDSHVEKKLQGHLDMIQSSVLAQTKAEKKKDRARREMEEKLMVEKELNSAAAIKRYMAGYHKRMDFYRMWKTRCAKEAAIFIQRVWRGIMGREFFRAKRTVWKRFIANTPYAIKMQKVVRGHHVRVHYPLVCQAMRDLYVNRQREAEAWVSVRFQANARRFLACKRTEAWREYVTRRNLDEFNAILILQMLGRRYNARTLLFQKRFEKLRKDKLEYTAASKIQAWYVKQQNRYLSKLGGKALQKAMNKKWRMTLTLQRSYRGYKGRERVNKVRIQKAVECYAAIKIQKHFRAARILYWKDMRLNVIAAYALDRHYIERRESVAASRLRYKAYVIENRRDSASNSDDPEDANMDAIWVKHFDYKKNRPYWINESSLTVTYDEPPVMFAKERSMVNMRVRVFWPVAHLWYAGTITDFHKRKVRHRIDYDDGDHEWMNLQDNQERVQIQLEDGSWIMVLMYKPPGEQEELRKKEKKDAEAQYKKQAFEDAGCWQVIQDDHDGMQPLIYMSTKTGEIRSGSFDAKHWVIHPDEFGYPCFFNVETQETVYEDPRFIHDTDKDFAAQRDYVMQEARYALYFCKDLWDQYMAAQGLGVNAIKDSVQEDEHGNPIEGTEVWVVDETKIDKREQHKIVLRVLNSDKPKHLASFLIRAKSYIKRVSVVDHALNEDEHKELELMQFISERMTEMRDTASSEILVKRAQKFHHVNKLEQKHSSKYGKQYFCVKCGEELQRHIDYCPMCGKRQIIM
jgi:hypothetical protein